MGWDCATTLEPPLDSRSGARILEPPLGLPVGGENSDPRPRPRMVLRVRDHKFPDHEQNVTLVLRFVTLVLRHTGVTFRSTG